MLSKTKGTLQKTNFRGHSGQNTLLCESLYRYILITNTSPNQHFAICKGPYAWLTLPYCMHEDWCSADLPRIRMHEIARRRWRGNRYLISKIRPETVYLPTLWTKFPLFGSRWPHETSMKDDGFATSLSYGLLFFSCTHFFQWIVRYR